MDGRRLPGEASQRVPLDTWLLSIQNRADISMRGEPPSEPTIFRVPPSLPCGNLCAYKPKLVSIGPYHRGNSDLKAMEGLKWRLLHDYLSKVPNGIMNEGVTNIRDLEKRARNCYSEVIYLDSDDYLSKVPNGMMNEGVTKTRDLEKRDRNCYSEVIYLDSDQFVEMLLLDGCFLVQIFMFVYIDGQEELRSLPYVNTANELKSLLFKNMWFRNLIFRDLLLLENQLPYFIVEHLLDTLRLPWWDSSIFQEVAISCFASFLPNNLNVQQLVLGGQYCFQVIHLLDLFHQWILSVRKSEETSNTKSCHNKIVDCLSKVLPFCNDSSLSDQELPLTEHQEETEHEDQGSQSVPTVTELIEAGVKIKVIREAKSFLNISFCEDKGVFEIPAITVDDNTNFLFANLIALEQTCNKHGLDVTHYAMFLDDIINTPIDVELLHQEGIIHRDLGDNKVIASLINKLGNGVIYYDTQNYLMDVRKGLIIYCQSRWPRWRAKAVHDYFNNPWTTISLAAAFLLLALTIIQTVYPILDFYKV